MPERRKPRPMNTDFRTWMLFLVPCFGLLTVFARLWYIQVIVPPKQLTGAKRAPVKTQATRTHDSPLVSRLKRVWRELKNP